MAAKKKASALDIQVALNTQRLDTMEPVLERILTRLDGIEEQLTRNKGFWGGVVLIGTAVWTLITAFKDDILKLWGSNG